MRSLRPSWHSKAACRGEGPKVFFEFDYEDRARELCAGCKVQDECREAGRSEVFGIWSGKAPRERGFGRNAGGAYAADWVPDWGRVVWLSEWLERKATG